MSQLKPEGRDSFAPFLQSPFSDRSLPSSYRARLRAATKGEETIDDGARPAISSWCRTCDCLDLTSSKRRRGFDSNLKLLMGTGSEPKAAPKVVKLDKALKLAEAWVNGMSGSTMDEPSELELLGRPSRLGLGAKVAPKAKPIASTDPVERKLLGKLNASKRKSSENLEKSNAAEEGEPSEDDDDEPESRTKAFVKKRAMPLVSTPQSMKRIK